MVLDEQDLRSGLKFICGVWQADYVVNAFSNDLAHIPAGEFKGDNSDTIASLSFEFKEDHTVLMKDDATGRESVGTWEQTDLCNYHYTVSEFLQLPDGPFKKNAETLHIVDGQLVFSIGFLAVALKKVAEGEVTEPTDIGDVAPSEDDLADMGIVGKYRVAKAMAMLNGDFGIFPAEEVKADLDRQLAAGEIDEDEYHNSLMIFDTIVEFTADHKVIQWMKLPEGVSDEQIKEAVEEGEIYAVADGYFADSRIKPWKAVDGKYYYDTGETREVFGEKQSSWDELTVNEEGLLPFADGMMMLKKL